MAGIRRILNKMGLIRSINWVLTYKCNSRCVHCDIWGLESRPEITLSSVRRILNDPLVKRSYRHYYPDFDISLGGGEPFLADNLQEIVCAIEKCLPGSFKSITTNGLCTKRIIEFVKTNSNLNYKINISIDGLGRVHDNIRGLKGAFDVVLQTILKVKRVNPGQKIEIKLTLLPDNYGQIRKVYELSRKLGCDFSFKPAENMKNYTNQLENKDFHMTRDKLCAIRNQAFYISDRMLKDGNHKKAKFFRDIPFYLFGTQKKGKCSVLNSHITILPGGSVYTCLFFLALGNLNESVLSDIWRSRRKKMPPCPSCMLMCGSFKDYSSAPFNNKTANFETTLACNLDCVMCTQRQIRKAGTFDMPLGAFSRIINRHPDISHVSFVGGEPFLNKDFFRMMNFLDAKAITYEITTNGTLINEKFSARLKGCVGLSKINFSLDGLGAYHDRERGRGVFKKCIRAILLCRGFANINVCSVLKKDNLSEILKLHRYLLKLKVKSYKLIYGMNFDSRTLEESRLFMPALKLQGPYLKDKINDAALVAKFFTAMKHDAEKRHSGEISFEPDLVQDKGDVLGDYPKGGLRCRQLEQYRFDSRGRRIVCEFIRNEYSPRLKMKIKAKAPSICRHCCKTNF